MKLKKYFIIGGALALSIGAITPFIVSCSSSQSATPPPSVNYNGAVNNISKEYSNTKASIDPSVYGNMTPENITKLRQNANDYLAKSQKLLAEMTATNQQNSDAAVWLQSLMYTFELEIDAYDANVQWLGSTGSYPLSHFRDYVVSYANNAAQSPSAASLSTTSVSNSIRRLSDLTTYLNTTWVNLQTGLDNNVMFSGVTFTLLMQDIIRNLGIGDFPTTYEEFSTPTTSYSIPNFRGGNGLWNPYKILKDARAIPTSTIGKLPADEYNRLEQQLTSASTTAISALNSFINNMKDTYSAKIASSDFGTSVDFNNPNKTVIENELIVQMKSTTPGAVSTRTPMPQWALSNNDLNEPNVGMGFMPDKDAGKKLYEYFLKLSTSTEETASDIHRRGLDAVADNINQMTEIANIVATIETGSPDANWTPTVKFTADPFATAPADVTLNIRTSGTININEFNKWLNSEQWFFGRGEIDPNTQLNDTFVYEKLQGLDSVDIKKILTDNGYDKWKDDASAYQASTTYQKAYIGANESLNSYYSFKDASVATIKDYFNNVKADYNINPYLEQDVAFEGVGAYSGGSSTFFENVDPYYGLQKWNVSTLSLHEAVPGHHFQDKYYVENKEDDALSFSYTAFAEGWGLFSEWLGVAFGIYGTPETANNGLPTTGLPKFEEPALGFIPTDAAELAKFQNGVYKTTEEGNALQYFGYLNEQQLRAMRLAVDTGLHAGDGNYTNGWSLKQVRDYMTNNSALGAGDIISESKRYLSYVGQATSYYTGKLVLQDLFNSYYNSVRNADKEFTKQNYKDFFHYVLKNNDVPLAVLESYVTSNLNFEMNTKPKIISSYDWLKIVTSEIPNRLAGDTNNTTQLYNEQKGEKYALDWIIKQLEALDYVNNPTTNPSRNEAPTINAPNTTNDAAHRVITSNLTSQQINDDLNFNGFFKQNYTWYTGTGQSISSNQSQNLVLNINSLDKSMSNPGDGSKKDVYIVSHYDTKNPLNQGVNDNSSGLATNLAIADYFKTMANRENLNYDLKLVFAGAEEVGIKGTWAFVNQYLTDATKNNTLAAINLDSVAGGDYTYVHSPNSDSGVAGANSDSTLRTELYEASNKQFLIHPQILPESPKRGQAGDYSDHVPFYQNGVMSTYIESTNFFIKSIDGYDGYSQTTNKAFWLNPDGTEAKLTGRQIIDQDGNTITVYDPPADINANNNYGRIWHTNFDTMEQLEKYFPGQVQSQMQLVFNALTKYLFIK